VLRSEAYMSGRKTGISELSIRDALRLEAGSRKGRRELTSFFCL
jgi:hypothetical protein